MEWGDPEVLTVPAVTVRHAKGVFLDARQCRNIRYLVGDLQVH
jgi:hypothetical protein